MSDWDLTLGLCVSGNTEDEGRKREVFPQLVPPGVESDEGK
jgi:hypothetical protein